MMLNDNLIDVWVTPGEKEGDPAKFGSHARNAICDDS